MYEAQYEFIKSIASLFNVTDEKILKKAVELITLLNLKPQLNCSATCKGVICLDIASSFTSQPISKNDAIKYSGSKKKTYFNMYNNISKLLNVDKVYSIKEICLIVQVCDVKESANQLFEKFKTKCDKVHYDFSHPMYACASVWAICRNKKIKINVSKLVEISRMKKVELECLTKKFEELIEKKNIKNFSKEKQDMHKSSKLTTESSDLPLRKRRLESDIMSDEEYKRWKRQMLEE